MVESMLSIDDAEGGVKIFRKFYLERTNVFSFSAASAFMQATQGDGGTLEDVQEKGRRTAERSAGSSGSKGRKKNAEGYGTKVTYRVTTSVLGAAVMSGMALQCFECFAHMRARA